VACERVCLRHRREVCELSLRIRAGSRGYGDVPSGAHGRPQGILAVSASASVREDGVIVTIKEDDRRFGGILSQEDVVEGQAELPVFLQLAHPFELVLRLLVLEVPETDKAVFETKGSHHASAGHGGGWG